MTGRHKRKIKPSCQKVKYEFNKGRYWNGYRGFKQTRSIWKLDLLAFIFLNQKRYLLERERCGVGHGTEDWNL